MTHSTSDATTTDIYITHPSTYLLIYALTTQEIHLFTHQSYHSSDLEGLQRLNPIGHIVNGIEVGLEVLLQQRAIVLHPITEHLHPLSPQLT